LSPPPESNQHDVAVIGGGPAGFPAAIQAAREGARTLLVEKGSQLGGTTTLAAVTGIQTFFAYGEQVIAGIGWELVCASFAKLDKPPPTGERYGEHNGVTCTMVDSAAYTAVLDEAVVGAGIDLRLHTMLGAAQAGDDAGGWRLTLCGKEGLYETGARVLIDATADANAVELAGHEVIKLPEHQPGTLVFQLGGYDAASLDYEAIQQAADAAIEAGELRPSDWGWHGADVRPLLKGYGGNRIHILGDGAHTSVGRTAMEIEGRRVMIRLLRFLRRQPGLADCHVVWQAAECGVRETTVIRGRSTITGEDYYAGRHYPDAVCYSFYPIDMHLEHGLDYRPLPRGVVPTIPFGAMAPVSSTNLLAAGRHISGDRVGSSAYRVQASCMAMGQAAGAAAVIAARTGTPVADVPIAEIHELLADHRAIVPTNQTADLHA